LSINWTKYLGSESKIAIDSSENQSEFNNTMFISMKAKDAIVDQLRTSDGIRPSVDIDNPDLRINIHIFRNQCTISLDSSGHSLHKRGYRTASVKAPLNEVLAAGLIYFSGWDGKTPFIDPMCGSGTIAIEACMLAKNIPAGYFTDGYNFLKWNNFNKQLWLNVVEEWNKKIKDIEIPIIAIDLAKSSIEATKENVEEAGLTNEIKIIQANFMDYENTFNEGVLIINPPYGERLSLEDVQEFYKQIGDTFKQKYKGMSAYIITSNPDGYKSIGLKTSRKMIVFNGGVECRYLKYEMYDGTKKIKIHDSIQTN
jgi:putative N6-adenine-specific DNA methylase